MTATQGVKTTILVGKESSWGVPIATAKSLGLVTNFTTNDEQKTQEHFGLGQAKAAAISPGAYTAKGNVEIEMAHGRMIEYAIYGGATVSTDCSLDCTHVFAWSDTLPSLTVEESFEQGTPDLVNKWAGVTFNSSTLGLTADGALTMRSDWLGKNVDVSTTTATAPSIPTGVPLTGMSGSVNLGGAVTNPISWEITVNRNTKLLHGLGNYGVPAAGGSHTASITWRATVSYESTSYHQKLLGNTTRNSTPASFTSVFAADNLVALGSGQRAISLQLTGCQLTSMSKPVTVNDFVIQELTGNGILGTGSMIDNVLNAAF